MTNRRGGKISSTNIDADQLRMFKLTMRDKNIVLAKLAHDAKIQKENEVNESLQYKNVLLSEALVRVADLKSRLLGIAYRIKKLEIKIMKLEAMTVLILCFEYSYVFTISLKKKFNP